MEQKMMLALGTTALTALLAGFGGGYWFAKNKLEVGYYHAANIEVATAKEEYRVKYEEKVLALAAENLQASVEEPLGDYPKSDIANTEAQFKEMLEKDIEAAEKLHKLYDTVEPPQEPAKLKPPVPMTSAPIAGPRRERPMVDYRGAFKADRITDPVVKEKATDDPVDPDEPFDIKEEEYYDATTGFDQRKLKWYAPDDVLANLADEVFEEPHLVVGDALGLFEDKDPEDNVLYVRNPTLKMDFEIVRIHESFAESVQGLMS